MGYCETGLSDFQNAETSYLRAGALNPKAPAAYQGLLTVYEKAGRISDFIKTCYKLAALYQELCVYESGAIFILHLADNEHSGTTLTAVLL